MPVTFSQIQSDTASVTLSTNFGPISISYYPNKITDEMIANMQAGTIDDNTLMETIVKSWDIMTDEDQSVMFPIARMNELGAPFKASMLMAIVENIRPNSTTSQTNA